MATPAEAAQWLVLDTGTAAQTPTNPAGTTRLEVPSLHLQMLAFGFFVDDSVAGVDLPPVGGFGQARSYFGAVSGFTLAIGSSITTQAPGGSSQIFILNDARGGAATSRVDQLTFNTGVVFNAGVPAYPLISDAVLPANGFFSSLAFGRTETGTADFPPIDQIWTNAPPVFMTFQIRAGSPTSGAALQALPVAFFNATNLNFALFELAAPVPERASWALMIAGFGLVGGQLRRRRMVA